MPSAMADGFDAAFAPGNLPRDIETLKARLERRLFLAPLPFDDESERYCASLRRQIDELDAELDAR